MNKIILSICFSLFVYLLSLPSELQATYTLRYPTESHQPIKEKDIGTDKTIDELLGPKDNFPFLPDNHRDSSNPIGRIGKIADIP